MSLRLVFQATIRPPPLCRISAIDTSRQGLRWRAFRPCRWPRSSRPFPGKPASISIGSTAASWPASGSRSRMTSSSRTGGVPVRPRSHVKQQHPSVPSTRTSIWYGHAWAPARCRGGRPARAPFSKVRTAASVSPRWRRISWPARQLSLGARLTRRNISPKQMAQLSPSVSTPAYRDPPRLTCWAGHMWLAASFNP